MSKKLPVVMIPGLNCTGDIFKHQIETFMRAGHEVIVIDNTTQNTNKQVADEILDRLPDRGIGEFHLVGFSMGGYNALEAMKQARGKERVKSFTLIGSTSHPDTEERKTERLGQIKEIEEGGAEAHKKISEGICKNMFAAENIDRLHDDYMKMPEEIGPQGFMNQSRQILSKGDLRNVPSQIKCPVKLIYGALDSRMPFEHRQYIVEQVFDAGGQVSMDTIEKAGHIVTMEAAEKVSGLMLDFIREAEKEKTVSQFFRK